MKQIIFSLTLALALIACNNKQAESTKTVDSSTETSIEVTEKQKTDVPEENETSIKSTTANNAAKIYIISNNSVDNVAIGESIKKFVADVQERYTVKKEEKMQEGESYEIYTVYDKNDKLYSVEPNYEEPNLVSRIWIYSPKFKTEQGIGIGSTLAEIKSKYKVDFNTENGLSVSVKEISGLLLLDNTKIPENWWNKMDTKKIPSDITIIEIVII
jgi:hypothetical protein